MKQEIYCERIANKFAWTNAITVISIFFSLLFCCMQHVALHIERHLCESFFFLPSIYFFSNFLFLLLCQLRKKKYRERKIFSCKFLEFGCVSAEVMTVFVRISPQSKGENFFFPFLFMCVLEHASIFMVHASFFSLSYFVRKLFGYLNSLLSLPPIHPSEMRVKY